jgi:hypothetical protein
MLRRVEQAQSLFGGPIRAGNEERQSSRPRDACMTGDQQLVPSFGPAEGLLDDAPIRDSVQPAREAGVIKRQVQNTAGHSSNLLGKGIANVGDDQTVELAGATGEERLGGMHRVAAYVNLSHDFPLAPFLS